MREKGEVVFFDPQREDDSPALRWLFSACDSYEQFYARLQLLLTPTKPTAKLPTCTVAYPTEEECKHEVGSVICVPI